MPLFGRTGHPAVGGSFVPTDIGGCVLWLRSDLGVTKDESNLVSAWDDQTLNLNDFAQSIPEQQPTFANNILNGCPGILSNITGSYTDSGLLTSGSIIHLPEGNNELTIFAIARCGSTERVGGLLGWNRNMTTGSFLFANTWGIPHVYSHHTDWSEENVNFNSLAFVSGIDYCILLSKNSSAQMSLTLNGSTQTIECSAVPVGYLNAMAVTAHSYGGVQLTYNWGNYIFEYAIYNSALFSDDKILLQNYTYSRYGI